MDIAGAAVGAKAPWDESPISEAYVIGQKEPSTQIMMAVVRRTEVAPIVPAPEAAENLGWRVSFHYHAPSELHWVVPFLSSGKQFTAWEWPHWSVADDAAGRCFVGTRFAEDHCAFVLLLDAEHVALNHARIKDRRFRQGKDSDLEAKPSIVYVCPGTPGDSGVEHVGTEYTVWKVLFLR